MADWVRLWHDMPTDPKWRVIARKSGKPLASVIALFTLMMTVASAADERGCVSSLTAEDAAAALDMDEADVQAIFDAMQERVVADGRLSGWDRRQPKREDQGNHLTGAKSAAERKRDERDRAKLARENETVTHCHDVSRNVTLETDTDTETEITDKHPTTAPPVSQSVGHQMLERLIAACGNHVSRGSKIEFTGPIDALMSQGCDLDRHILPTLTRIVPNMTTPLNSWGAPFLTREILAARDKDLQAHALPPRLDDQPVTSWELPFRQWKSARGHWPGGKYGPSPIDAGCKVPADVLAARASEIASARAFMAEAAPAPRSREVA